MAFDPLEDREVDLQPVQDEMGANEMITHVETSNACSSLNIMAEDSQQSTKRSNHTWTAEEDKVLVECLIDIGSNFKGDNGFKPVFSAAIEKLMHQRIPGCTLRGIPHITSWVKLLKNHYNAIAEMIGPNGGSGFGWNDIKKQIEVEREIFNDWVTSHPNAKGLFNKPFPYYESLGAVFGKDVATELNVEEPADTVYEME
ncbi:uncharacterized protein LOC133285469 [Gastrolobium bilobum]|uniref:uncharacterized protein LOC133285469 n=1 Tax=Gastrolobium bilobum TaxID=150636 RepID=UPI002AB31C22|nr:uncharacterized protein LOC133285469 [Gastrolobium bilobum]